MKLESKILQKLNKMRKSLHNEVKVALGEDFDRTSPFTYEMRQKLQPGIKVALCGKCLYNDDIKTLQEKDFYPFCECYIKNKNTRVYYPMLFEDISIFDGKTRSQIRKIKMDMVNAVSVKCENEIVKHDNLRGGFLSWLRGVDKFSRMIRRYELVNYSFLIYIANKALVNELYHQVSEELNLLCNDDIDIDIDIGVELVTEFINLSIYQDRKWSNI